MDELERLLQGNENFINGNLQAENKCLKTLRNFQNYQEPKAIILSCSDSRVVPEIIFDTGIGELFVIRTAGATIGQNVIESIEFAIDELKIPLLLVLGHDNCGVVTYAAKNPEGSEHFHDITSQVHEILDCETLCYNQLAKKHTLNITSILKRKSKFIQNAINNNSLTVVSAHFHFDTGKVTILKEDE